MRVGLENVIYLCGILVPLFAVGLQFQYVLQIQDKDYSSRTNSGVLVSWDQFESWLEEQTEIAFNGIIDNVGGISLAGVISGAAIASPSKRRPNYYYIWTRDNAITMNSILSQYLDLGQSNDTLQSILDSYIESSYMLQRTSNPSGDFQSLEGLGEPKFQVDGTPFTDTWGRPQRDGPALRAMVLCKYVATAIESGTMDFGQSNYTYWEVIKPDLEYVANTWHKPGFDLWEEVYGMHFFTAAVQHHSLALGKKLATAFEDWGAYQHYSQELHKLASFMGTFVKEGGVDEGGSYLIETLGYPRSGLDSGLVLASLMTMETATAKHIVSTPFNRDYLIGSVCRIINDMRNRYPVNSHRRGIKLSAVAIGRYPEDMYDGVGTSQGNPWFLCTAAMAQFMYELADELHGKPADFVLTFPRDTQCLYSKFLDYLPEWNKNPGTLRIRRDSPIYAKLINDLVGYGDSFLDVIREHRDMQDGSMSEQFSRYDGYMRGAERLTWSFSAFWSASRQRNITLSRIARR